MSVPGAGFTRMLGGSPAVCSVLQTSKGRALNSISKWLLLVNGPGARCLFAGSFLSHTTSSCSRRQAWGFPGPTLPPAGCPRSGSTLSCRLGAAAHPAGRGLRPTGPASQRRRCQTRLSPVLPPKWLEVPGPQAALWVSELDRGAHRTQGAGSLTGSLMYYEGHRAGWQGLRPHAPAGQTLPSLLSASPEAL